MIDKHASRMAGILCENNIIREEDKEIVAYGLDALLSTLINLVIILALGLLLGKIADTAVFLLAFATLRVFAGGYHAKTRIGCTATFLVIYLSGMALLHHTPDTWVQPAAIAVALASLALVLWMAPIEHPNRPFTDNEYLAFKKASRTIACLEALLVLSGSFLPGYSKLAYCISLAMLGVVIILALARNIESRRD